MSCAWCDRLRLNPCNHLARQACGPWRTHRHNTYIQIHITPTRRRFQPDGQSFVETCTWPARASTSSPPLHQLATVSVIPPKHAQSRSKPELTRNGLTVGRVKQHKHAYTHIHVYTIQSNGTSNPRGTEGRPSDARNCVGRSVPELSADQTCRD